LRPERIAVDQTVYHTQQPWGACRVTAVNERWHGRYYVVVQPGFPNIQGAQWSVAPSRLRASPTPVKQPHRFRAYGPGAWVPACLSDEDLIPRIEHPWPSMIEASYWLYLSPYNRYLSAAPFYQHINRVPDLRYEWSWVNWLNPAWFELFDQRREIFYIETKWR
jgi:hypothetical protein